MPFGLNAVLFVLVSGRSRIDGLFDRMHFRTGWHRIITLQSNAITFFDITKDFHEIVHELSAFYFDPFDFIFIVNSGDEGLKS